MINLFAKLIFILILLNSCVIDDGIANVSLINNSDEIISELVVDVGGEKKTFKRIPPKGKISSVFIVEKDTSYKIDVKFSSGRVVAKELGYITNGKKFSDQIEISINDIELSNREVSSKMGEINSSHQP